MATISPKTDAARQVRALCDAGSPASLGDADLLERFASGPGDRSELAFAALVGRHGPMVLQACRAILRDPHEAEDAFQSTFLLLARRGATLWVRDSIAPWLHAVACRTAAGIRAARGRRRNLERRAAGLRVGPGSASAPDDRAAALHEEIDRLPDRLKGAVVLCYLQGLTHDQAASHLGCPVGTVRSRLARGRDRLRSRLGGAGLAPPAPGPLVPASVPLALASTTARAAAVALASPVASGFFALAPSIVVRGASLAMMHPMKAGALILLTSGAVVLGVAAGRLPAQGRGNTATGPGVPASFPAGADTARPIPDGKPNATFEQYRSVEAAILSLSLQLASAETSTAKLRNDAELEAKHPEIEQWRKEQQIEEQIKIDPELLSLLGPPEAAKARRAELERGAGPITDPTLLKARDRLADLKAGVNAACDYRKAQAQTQMVKAEENLTRLRETRDTLIAELTDLKLEILRRPIEPQGQIPAQGADAAAERDTRLERRLADLERKLAAKPGRIEPTIVDDRRTLVRIRPRFADCLVVQVLVEPGQAVKKGDPLLVVKGFELTQVKNDLMVKFVQWDHDYKYLVARKPLADEGRITKIIWTDTQNDEKKSRLDYLVARERLASFGIGAEELDAILRPLGDGNRAAMIQDQADLEAASKLTIRAPMDASVVSRDAVADEFYNQKDVLMILTPTKP